MTEPGDRSSPGEQGPGGRSGEDATGAHPEPADPRDLPEPADPRDLPEPADPRDLPVRRELPEPADPRELPQQPDEPGAPGARTAVVDHEMAGAANLARFAAAVRRPASQAAVGGLVVALGVIGAVVGSHWWSPLLWVLSGGMCCAWIAFRAGAKAVRAAFPANTPVTVTARASGLRLQTPEGQYTAPWSTFRSVVVVRDHLVLQRAGTGGALVLPPALYGEDTVQLAIAGIAPRRVP